MPCKPELYVKNDALAQFGHNNYDTHYVSLFETFPAPIRGAA